MTAQRVAVEQWQSEKLVTPIHSCLLWDITGKRCKSGNILIYLFIRSCSMSSSVHFAGLECSPEKSLLLPQI